MKKKLLMISSTWRESYIHKMIYGMLQRLENEEIDLYIFNAYDEALESEYKRMERAIYNLPDEEKFDGVLLAINTVGNQTAAEKLAQHYQNLGKKVLSLDLRLTSVPFIGTDNYKAEYELLEHLIQVHGCRTFNYVGGPDGHKENQERYQAFCDCLKAYGIPFEKERVLSLSFQKVDGMEAYRQFREKGIHLPDAVVCANDNMAIGYCLEAAKDGFVAPDHFRIVGFDNIDEGQDFYPSITSVDRCWEQLGYQSIEQLLDMINGTVREGEYFEGQHQKINESCGCAAGKRNLHHDFGRMFKKSFKDDQIDTSNRKSRKLLCGSSNMKEFQKRLAACQTMTGIEEIAICLNASLFLDSVDNHTDYDQEFDIYTYNEVYRQKKQEGLLPKKWTVDRKMYFFSPLHFGNINFGYCVIPYSGTWMEELDHRNFLENICLSLEGIRQHATLNRMNQRLEDLYVRDAMTGMYNRFGYESFAKKFYADHNGSVYVAYLDLDNLKLYNDRFGHEIGDSAILGVSTGIYSAFGENAVYVRMGGDEFLVVGGFEGRDALLQREGALHEFLADYSIKKNLPFSLSVSIGYICNENGQKTLEEMIWVADHNMYQDKQKKKQKKLTSPEHAEPNLINAEFAEIIEKVPDAGYDVDSIFGTFRKYVPDITSRYGVVYLTACIVEFSMNTEEQENRNEMMIYDIRTSPNTVDYNVRFETGRGGFVTVTFGIPEDKEWTASMRRDMYILAKTIFLLVGRATAMRALANLTFTDQMTEIANSKKLNQVMLQELERGMFHHFCNNFVNIKNMKLFNGKYGDKMGDQLIIKFSNTLKQYVGERGCVARLGGDNFIVFLEADRQDDFLQYMRELTLVLYDGYGKTFSVKVRTRIGSYMIQAGDSISAAMSNCSIAFHYAQMEGTEDQVFFEGRMKSEVLRFKELEENTPEAIRNHEFVIYYQPKADISDFGKFRLNGGEALIRWRKDEQMILPFEFIPVLEKSGQITEIDFYVFEQVCKDICEWQERGIEPVRISSNFSRRHLKDESFIDRIEQIVREYQVAPQYLEIEITESYDMDDIEVLKKFEKRMHKLGISLAVDDFGSGFSSIRMIKNIFSDTIKLDKSVIDGIGENRGDEIIVQHMVQMIQSLGKQVIAEGVENEIQANFLRENDCNNIQGYLFGKPMTKEEFEQLLLTRLDV